MNRRLSGLLVLAAALAFAVAMPLSAPTDAARPPRPTPTPTPSSSPPPPAPVQVYGAWHCSDDYCTWGTARDGIEFDSQNHWLIIGIRVRPMAVHRSTSSSSRS